jgi:hypothetical protein
MAVIISVLKQADFVSVSPLHSSILFVGKAGVIVNVAPSWQLQAPELFTVQN